MKKTLLLIALFLVSAIGYAQDFYFSIDYVEACDWNENTGQFEDCQQTRESSVWMMNEKQTLFKHRTETMQSTYWVNKYDKSLTDEYENKFGYYIQSDAGYRYYLILDFDHNCIKVMPDGRVRDVEWSLLYAWKNTWQE